MIIWSCALIYIILAFCGEWKSSHRLMLLARGADRLNRLNTKFRWHYYWPCQQQRSLKNYESIVLLHWWVRLLWQQRQCIDNTVYLLMKQRCRCVTLLKFTKSPNFLCVFYLFYLMGLCTVVVMYGNFGLLMIS